MQQYLYLVRHAHALAEAPSDELRPLSPKGHRQCDRLVKAFDSKELIKVTAVWQSGLVRATETATALWQGLQLPASITQVDGLAPFDDPKPIAAKLDDLTENCLVAGHEPNLSSLASILLGGTSVVFPKASILCLSRMKAGKQATNWQIEWHISHRLFK